MRQVNIIFPYQLFENSPLPLKKGEVYLIEEDLFFRQYAFHKQKIAYMRAAMKFYEGFLSEKGCKVHYISSGSPGSDIRELLAKFSEKDIQQVNFIELVDDWLERRIRQAGKKYGITLKQFTTPMFINTRNEVEEFFDGKKRMFQTDFYIYQRKKTGILMEKSNKPLGGKWSFDAENRKKYPRGKTPPQWDSLQKDAIFTEAVDYVNTHFADNPGRLSDTPLYPFTHTLAKKWLQSFFENRFHDFGPYEDAIVARESILHHSVLTPMLNIGLLTPTEVVEEAVGFGLKNEIPINSLEGFVRQIMGWREFIRAVYELKGREERIRNFWDFQKKIPSSFYTAQTGITPVDNVIDKVLTTGYAHHIERLMVLGNFMLLSEFDPDEVYRWFMELFIDAWDWVMVPNVYGMSQFADGGIMATKPYISGSNYLMKMSNYPKGEWQSTWDGLFWHFMDKNRPFFLQNPRLGMLIKTFDRMDASKKTYHYQVASLWFEKISKNT